MGLYQLISIQLLIYVLKKYYYIVKPLFTFAKHFLMLFDLCHTSKLWKTVAKLSAARKEKIGQTIVRTC